MHYSVMHHFYLELSLSSSNVLTSINNINKSQAEPVKDLIIITQCLGYRHVPQRSPFTLTTMLEACLGLPATLLNTLPWEMGRASRDKDEGDTDTRQLSLSLSAHRMETALERAYRLVDVGQLRRNRLDLLHLCVELYAFVDVAPANSNALTYSLSRVQGSVTIERHVVHRAVRELRHAQGGQGHSKTHGEHRCMHVHMHMGVCA